jgi:hypothetical protein
LLWVVVVVVVVAIQVAGVVQVLLFIIQALQSHQALIL